MGENLQDHYQARTIVRLRNRVSLNDAVRSPLKLAGMGFEWLTRRSGPLTVGAGQVGGAACTQHAVNGRPDVQFNVMPLSVDKPGDPLHAYPGFTASACQCRPLSRGRLQIRSADPLAAPRIETNYLAEQFDRDTLAAGVQMLREIYAQPAFRDLVAAEMLPGAAAATRADLVRFGQQAGGTVFHPVGTCRMGQRQRGRGRPGAARARRGAAARDRRLGHARHGVGQHQCGGNHDRRERRGAGAGRRRNRRRQPPGPGARPLKRKLTMTDIRNANAEAGAQGLPLLRLAKVEALVFRAPVEVPVQTSFGTMYDRPAVLVRVEDRAGMVGWGEIWCNFPGVGAEHRARVLESCVAPILLERDWEHPAEAFDTLSRRLHVLGIQSGEPGTMAQAIEIGRASCRERVL